jgi:hypothetical protein
MRPHHPIRDELSILSPFGDGHLIGRWNYRRDMRVIIDSGQLIDGWLSIGRNMHEIDLGQWFHGNGLRQGLEIRWRVAGFGV